MPAYESTSAAVDASASTSDARTPLPAALDPSPRVRFVEPVAVVPPKDAEVDPPPDVQSPYHDNQHNAALLLDVGAEEPYRPSPEIPSPAPESDEEVQVTPKIAPRILGEKDASFVPAEPEAVPSERGASPIAMPPPSPGSTSPAAPAPQPLAREPSPPPTALLVQPPVVKVAFKEWQAWRKLERAKEEEFGQERECERQKEQEREREQREKDAQGENGGNEVVPPKPEDGLSRILDGIRRSAVSDKPPACSRRRHGGRRPSPRGVSRGCRVGAGRAPAEGQGDAAGMTAFVVTGNEHLLTLPLYYTCSFVPSFTSNRFEYIVVHRVMPS
ncbi:hypothetical protein B0H10DRAFT_353328 [Mycena sp. CBHHK59/15]|nr:hypothetical protein B0H10DRAFT_353328 [Mycena sp. CBHHK59/15]